MKLLFCPECSDVIKLIVGELRSCQCGKVKGKYIDNTHAEVDGEGYSLAIGNGSLMMACCKLKPTQQRRPPGSEIICWVRPHEGDGNPHTRINPNLGKKRTRTRTIK